MSKCYLPALFCKDIPEFLVLDEPVQGVDYNGESTLPIN